jgi:hypothetical protein
MRDPKNEHEMGFPTINPKQKRKTPQQQNSNDKKQCKYKNKFWI